MKLAATLYQQPTTHRLADRSPLGRVGTLRNDRGEPIDVVIVNLAVGGARIDSPVPLDLNERIVLGIPGLGRHILYVVWADGARHGCRFATPLRQAEVDRACAMGSNVHDMGVDPLPADPLALEWGEPSIDKAPLPIRFRIIVGSTLLLWGSIGYGVWSLLRH